LLIHKELEAHYGNSCNGFTASIRMIDLFWEPMCTESSIKNGSTHATDTVGYL
jgi:hypothetical protein